MREPFLQWVKSGKAQNKQMFSGLRRKADTKVGLRAATDVPACAANRLLKPVYVRLF
jgi:hypothetical protein